MKKLALILLVTSALSACNDSELTHDVQHYLDNPEERAKKLAECKNNPGEKALAANCVNAREARRQAVFDSRNKGMPKIH